MAGFLYRSDMHRIQATIAGVTIPNTFVWDSFGGADIAQDNSYYHAGNMADAMPTGGLATPTDCTITVAWRSDVFPLYVPIWTAVNHNSPVMTVSVTPLNQDHSATVKPLTWSGIAISVTKPQFEAAASSIGYLSVVMAPAATVTQN